MDQVDHHQKRRQNQDQDSEVGSFGHAKDSYHKNEATKDADHRVHFCASATQFETLKECSVVARNPFYCFIFLSESNFCT